MTDPTKEVSVVSTIVSGSAATVSRFSDLIYCSQSEAKELLALYPDAKIEDASDLVHEERFSIDFVGERRRYFKDLLRCGLHSVSLQFGLATLTKKDVPMLKEIVAELKTG